MAAAEPLTPDFYRYPWHPLCAADLDGELVRARWADGTELAAHAWWLRENVVAEGAVDPVTREGTLDPATFAADLSLCRVAVGEDGALELDWSDGFGGRIHPGWLRHVADGQHQVNAWLPELEPWTGADLAEPPTFDGTRVLVDDGVLLEWLEALVRLGIGRLENLPAEEGTVLAVADRIGVQRSTNFGLDFPVKAEILANDENSTANTTLRLGPHTDLPTREVPPGFQLLHCIENTVAGGWSRMTDGAAVARHLVTHEPETYEALTSLRWIFFNRSREHDHRWSGPLLDGGRDGTPLTIRAFYPVRAFPDMDERDVPRAYRAAKRFNELCADERFQIGYPFRPGDLVGFDNRRVLHGRDAFDAGGGRRYLRGCYLDRDEVLSRLRVLRRRAQESSSPRSTT